MGNGFSAAQVADLLRAWCLEKGAPTQRPSFEPLSAFCLEQADAALQLVVADDTDLDSIGRFFLGLALILADGSASQALQTFFERPNTDDYPAIIDVLRQFDAQELLSALQNLALTLSPQGLDRLLFFLAQRRWAFPLGFAAKLLEQKDLSPAARINLVVPYPGILHGDLKNLFLSLKPGFTDDRRAQVDEIVAALADPENLVCRVPGEAPNDQPAAVLMPVKAVDTDLSEAREEARKQWTTAPKRSAHAPAGQPWYAPFRESRPLLLGTTFAVMVLVLAIGAHLWSLEEKIPEELRRSGQKVWIDAVTRQPVTESMLMADKEFRMGEIFRQRREFAEAAKFYREAVRLNGTHLESLDRLGYCHWKSGSHEAAEEQFRKALTIDPTFYRSHFYLGRISRFRQDWDAALNEFATAYAQRPDLSIIGREYAEVLLQLGRFTEAIELLSDLVTRFPKDPQFSEWLQQAQEGLVK